MYVLSVYMCEATVTRYVCCLYTCVKLLLLGICVACMHVGSYCYSMYVLSVYMCEAIATVTRCMCCLYTCVKLLLLLLEVCVACMHM